MSRMADAAYGGEFAPYPLSPGYKTGGTSRDAARAVSASAPLLRERVFATIRDAGARGLTPDETAAAIGESVLGVRPRFSELGKTGRIIPTGERRTNQSGLKAKAWRVQI